MKKPEKKDETLKPLGNIRLEQDAQSMNMGYNQACDDWEKFLPSEEEIAKILIGINRQTMKEGKEQEISREEPYVYKLAKAIYKRIRGENETKIS